MNARAALPGPWCPVCGAYLSPVRARGIRACVSPYCDYEEDLED